MLKKIVCVNSSQAKLVCLTKNCDACPFLCGKICQCQKLHTADCQLKNIQQMTDDIKRILQFEWLVIFSQKLKGQGIQVAGRQVRQYNPPPRNARFVLTLDSVPLDKSVQVQFKVISLKGCVGMGMFLRDILIATQFNYIPQKDYLGHGGYMIMSNQYKYSHSEKTDNFKQVEGFQMKEGSLITLKYSNGLLTFRINNKYAYLKIPLNNPQQSFHFGVYLYEVGDSVEILRRK